MKTRILCIALCIATALLMIGSVRSIYGAAVTQTDGVTTVLRLASYADGGHPSTLAARYFAERVGERTNGRISIQVVEDGELGEEKATVEQLEFGGIAFAVVCCLAMPEDTLAEHEDGTLTLDPDALDMHRLKLFGEFAPDYRCIANSSGLLTDRARCTGVSVGAAYTSERLLGVLGRYGFDVVPHSGGDLVGSLHYGYLDAMELSLMSYATKSYAQALPYLSVYDGPRAPDVLLASQVSMGKLPAEDQRIIRECAGEAAQYQQASLSAWQAEAVSQLVRKNVQIYPQAFADEFPGDGAAL